MTKKFIPEDWKKQWSKFMVNFYEYLPVKYKAGYRDKLVRETVWKFKDGKLSLIVADIVAKRMQQQFGEDVKNITFVCIPASNAAKNEARYKVFSEEVARLTDCINAYNAITIEGGRLAVHETKGRKVVAETETINFDKDFFKGKKCLVFDDVLTLGHSYARFACALERMGAEVLGGYFLAKTVIKNK